MALQFIFLNQVSGTLFRELAEDIAEEWGESILFTGNLNNDQSTKNLLIRSAPGYSRKNAFYRLFSWMAYGFNAALFTLRQPSNVVLFIVSNPPFLGLIGYLLKKIRKQPYVMLVYDIYPDLLVNFGVLKKDGLFARLWRRFNRIVWENASAVFTIGEVMAQNLERMFDPSKTPLQRIEVIQNWADENYIQPISKGNNPFVKEHCLADKLTVLYSGNLGATHDIETILLASQKMADYRDIKLLIVGEGTKRTKVEAHIRAHNPMNLTLLPFQPDELYPYSLASAELAIVTLGAGAEGLSFPSKTAFTLAAGSAILGLVSEESDLALLIRKFNCGAVVPPGNADLLAKAILKFHQSPDFLEQCRKNARKAFEQYYTRKNTQDYIRVLKEIL